MKKHEKNDQFIDVDKKLMKKIENLINSGSLDNKNKALDLIEREDTQLSGYYAKLFFEQLIQDKSVKERTISIFDKKLGKEVRETLEDSFQKYNLFKENFRNLSVHTNKASEAYDTSHNIVKIVRNSLDVPINSNALKPAFKLEKAQQNRYKSLSIPHTIPPKISPTITTSTIISHISKVPDRTLTIPQALGKSIPEIKKELDELINTDKDVIFNFEGYPVLYNLERFLRDLIKDRICKKEPKMIKNRIPEKILNQWEDRRRIEQSNPIVSGIYDLIDYSDFTELKMIFEKGKNIQLFHDICSEEQFRIIISKLHELDPIRKKIAHSRPLRKEEFDRLKMYANDIDKILNPKDE